MVEPDGRRYAVGSDAPDHKGIAIVPADRFEVHYTLDYPATLPEAADTILRP